MSRLEYLTKLRQYLEEGGLQKEELDDAMRFYEEIFLDAGAMYEEQTAANLGSPEELAKKILIDNNIHADGDAVFQMDEAVSQEQARAQYQQQQQQMNNGGGMSVLAKVLIAAITFPIWLPIVCALGGVAFGFVVALIAIIFSFCVAGVALLGGGIFTLIHVPPIGLMMIGSGLIFVSLCSLVLSPFFKWLWRTIVRFFNWIVNGIRRIFGVGSVNGND